MEPKLRPPSATLGPITRLSEALMTCTALMSPMRVMSHSAPGVLMVVAQVALSVLVRLTVEPRESRAAWMNSPPAPASPNAVDCTKSISVPSRISPAASGSYDSSSDSSVLTQVYCEETTEVNSSLRSSENTVL